MLDTKRIKAVPEITYLSIPQLPPRLMLEDLAQDEFELAVCSELQKIP
jgi:hypothetical protein